MKILGRIIIVISVGAFCNASEVRDAQAIRQLASDEYAEREAATRMLWERGQEVVEILEEARRSDQPETAIRASELLAYARMKITPETSPEVIVLVENYLEAGEKEKIAILGQLKERRAWFQALRLFSDEPEQVKKGMRPVLRGVAITAAREEVMRDDAQAALDVLRISPFEYTDLMALAAQYWNMGMLDSELEKAEPPGTISADKWRLALLRVKGDVEGARKVAEGMGAKRTAAYLEVLMGNPEGFLEGYGSGKDETRVSAVYRKLALRRWGGEQVSAKDLLPLEGALEAEEQQSQLQAMAALATLGEPGAAELLQEKMNPEVAFRHYLSQEQIDKALAVYELKPDFEGLKKRVEDHLENLTDEKKVNREDLLRESGRLRQVLAFLETTGQRQVFEEAFAGPLLEFAKKDRGKFLSVLTEIFQQDLGAPRFAFELASEWAGDDDEKWNEVFMMPLNENLPVGDWLPWLRKENAEAGEGEILEIALALFRITDDPKGLRAKWIERAWEVADETGGEADQEMLGRIMRLAETQGDVGNALRAYDEMPGNEGWGTIDRFFSAAGRWKEAAEFLGENAENLESSSPEMHAYLAINFRRAGMLDEAERHDLLAEKLTLGFAPSCARIAASYAYGGFMEQAEIWYARAGILANTRGSEFIAALSVYAPSMLRTKQWERAAAAYEALALFQVHQGFRQEALIRFVIARLNADLPKALAELEDDRQGAIARLDKIHEVLKTNGILADEFFPLVREAGLVSELGGWFEDSWAGLSAVVERYPASDNTRNTAAWFASRAQLRLDEAREHLDKALERKPNQPAYLDTMAETYFAEGEREKAVEWSARAVQNEPFDDMIRSQYRRFETAELPR